MKTRNNLTENDRFSRMIRNKLADYSLPPEEGAWEALEKSLHDRDRKRIPLWPWLSGISAAASVALVLSIAHHQNNIYNEDTDRVSYHAERLTENVLAEENLSSADPTDRPIQPAHLPPAIGKDEGEELAFHEPDLTATEPAVPDTESPDGVERIREADPQPALNRRTEVFPEEKPFVVGRKAGKRRGSFGVHVSSGGGLYAANNTLREAAGNHSSELRYSQPAPNAQNFLGNDLFRPEDFGKISHRPPVSIGLSVRKTLTDYLSIESGLTYSYLYSTLESKIPQRDASMTLHYLGIPVNLSLDLLPRWRSAWSIYLSVGGMAEKGLLAHYVQNTHTSGSNVVVTTVSNEKIGGLQWSVQAALGVSYRLHRDYSLFLEPKVNYYLDNNQPFNARTEHPLVPGLNIGLRHTW
jgi:hypothetical protein